MCPRTHTRLESSEESSEKYITDDFGVNQFAAERGFQIAADALEKGRQFAAHRQLTSIHIAAEKFPYCGPSTQLSVTTPWTWTQVQHLSFNNSNSHNLLVRNRSPSIQVPGIFTLEIFVDLSGPRVYWCGVGYLILVCKDWKRTEGKGHECISQCYRTQIGKNGNSEFEVRIRRV